MNFNNEIALLRESLAEDKIEDSTFFEDLNQCLLVVRQMFKNENYEESKLLLDLLERATSNLDSELCNSILVEIWFFLGMMHLEGLGVEKNIKSGIDYLKRTGDVTNVSTVAEYFVRRAQYNLGWLYYYGVEGVPADRNKSQNFWKRAAGIGSVIQASIEAQNALGLFYSHPDHLDLKKAYYWHKLAAQNRNQESTACVGIMYLYGLGVRRNSEMALNFLMEPACKGDILATAHLIALFYSKQLYKIVVKLAEKVLAMYGIKNCLKTPGTKEKRLLCNKGMSIASFYLARCLQRGYGIKQDTYRSSFTFRKAINFCPMTCFVLHKKMIMDLI